MKPQFKFSSTIGPIIARYVDFKQALGRTFVAAQYILARFDRFLESIEATDLDLETFNAWTSTLARVTPTTRCSRQRIVYHFCVFRRRSDPACFIPDPSLFPSPQPRPWPYIFSENEIARLLLATEGLIPRPSFSPLRRQVARIAIVLLYTAGLRRGELVRLTLGDYDVGQRLLRINDSKFHKSRLVPLSKDAAEEMERYLVERCKTEFPCSNDSRLLFNGFRGTDGYTGHGLAQIVKRLFKQLDIRTAKGFTPRIHDLRFTFAVHAILRWYRAGVDVQARLPALATFMGHCSVISTQYYLMFVESLAQTACERFNKHCSHFLFPQPPRIGGSK